MEISKRLKLIADYVQKNSKVVDIGTDHAYLPIYLVKEQKVQQVLAMDINKGPLAKAKENIIKYGLNNQIETRLSNGLQKLGENEADTVIIAGMGGMLVENILRSQKNKLNRINRLILQPQSDYEAVRRAVHELGFKIIDEDMIKDGHKYYVVLVCEQGVEQYDDTAAYKYGKQLMAKQSSTYVEFMKERQKTINNLIHQLEDERSQDAKLRLHQLREELLMIKEIIK